MCSNLPRENTEPSFEAIYDDLRRNARRLLRRQSPDFSWSATTLVHETYLKMVSKEETASKALNIPLFVKAMSDALVDHARARLALKRGGGRNREHFSIDQVLHSKDRRQPEEILYVNELLDVIDEAVPQHGTILRLRALFGCTLHEIADSLGVSQQKIKDEFKFLRQWIRARADGGGIDD